MTGVRMRVVVGIAALSLLAAACGGVSEEGGGAPDSNAGATSKDNPGAGGLYGGGAGESDETGPTGATEAEADVSVSLNNYLFDPADVEVASGDVVEVRNGNARTPHTFTVVGEDVDVELAPLVMETVQIELQPGTYDLICRFHEELGMTGTLTVT